MYNPGRFNIMSKSLSRRAFLGSAATAVAGVLLAACQPKTVTQLVEVEKEVTRVVEKEVAAQPAASDVKLVRIMMSAWALGQIPLDRTSREYTDAHDDIEVRLESTAEGWDTKVIAMIADGTLPWSAAGILTPFIDMKRWHATGMIQPMDDYLLASKEPGADQILDDMIPTVRQDSSVEGKLYGLPYSFENITFNWRTDYFAAVGATEAPETWDDWFEIAIELKKWGADENIYPTSFAAGLHTDVGALLCSASDKPYADDGLYDWESPEMIESLAFYKKLITEHELTPPHGSDGWVDAYYAGQVASVQAQSSRGVWGQNAFGTDKVVTSPICTKVKGGGSGANYWGNGTAILNGAPYPQEATDYLIYTMGPQNTSFQQATIRTGKTPVYNSVYENIIMTNPQFRTYMWMVDMREDVARSTPHPFNNYWAIQNTVFQKYRIPFTTEGSTMSPEECAQLILDESREEVERQRL
jgi:multiple sugar transport system substrate-binding protein